MTTRYTTLASAEKLIDEYIDAGGQVTTVREGVLGLGTVVLSNGGNSHLREFVIEEYYISAWASGHKVRIYTHGLPKKYAKIINQ